jgi:hypothetical protein
MSEPPHCRTGSPGQQIFEKLHKPFLDEARRLAPLLAQKPDHQLLGPLRVRGPAGGAAPRDRREAQPAQERPTSADSNRGAPGKPIRSVEKCMKPVFTKE